MSKTLSKTKKCAVCADLCFCLVCIAFLMSVAVAIVVATAPYFDLKGHTVMTYGQIQNVFVYMCNYWL